MDDGHDRAKKAKALLASGEYTKAEVAAGRRFAAHSLARLGFVARALS